MKWGPWQSGEYGQRADSSQPPVPEGRRLRTIVADKYPSGNVYVGGATSWSKRKRGAGVIVDREFSYVTPENDFKQIYIHPEPDTWRWEYADAWIEHCATHKQILRLHAPIGPQCSKWAKDDSRTPQELKQNLIEYTTELYKRYDKHEHVKWIDVVNETILGNGKWHGPRTGTEKWQNPWTKIGYDNEHPLKPPLYIKMAFEIANQHAPNTKLIINQNFGMEQPMWDKVKALVHYLREHGLRVDGIGWQAHISAGWEKKHGNRVLRLAGNPRVSACHEKEAEHYAVSCMRSHDCGELEQRVALAELFNRICG